MATLSAIIGEIKPLIRTHLVGSEPEGQINLLTSVQAAGMSFVEDVKAGEVVLPCAILVIGDYSPEQWTVNGQWARVPVTIILVAPQGETWTQPDIAQMLHNLRLEIDSPSATFSSFQPIEWGAVTTDMTFDLQEDMLAQAQLPGLAGALMYRPGVLVDMSDAGA